MDFIRSILGLAGFIFVAWCFSKNRKAINWKTVGVGITLQFCLAKIVLTETVQRAVFDPVNDFVIALLGFSQAGATFVLKSFVSNSVDPANINFAFWVLPTVIFFSSIMALLYHFGIMQPIIKGISRVMQKLMGTSGSESMSCSANIFVGQTEAPLMIKPFIDTMTKSELHAVMVGGFGTVAGGVLALYVGILQESMPGIAGHLATASVMAAPGALVISKIMYPETEESNTMGEIQLDVESLDSNFIEAAARGATEGMQLLINIVAMLIAFVALVTMLDQSVLSIAQYFSPGSTFSFTSFLGYLFTPFAFLMGVPSHELLLVGQLLGKKVVLTELLAYAELSTMIKAGTISAKSQLLCSYALCGFANFASIGIQIGGLGAMAPSRKGELATMGLSAMFGGMLVTCCTATIAGAFIHIP
ncbi:MAG: NupC/NupG family nucleoside CNT transporter [Candidatus Cloacimonadota bacterium]|nr:MAG: NupC/NupG family nucleoside CNT transporter [Candidatus Cloacimonadota bacterium]